MTCRDRTRSSTSNSSQVILWNSTPGIKSKMPMCNFMTICSRPMWLRMTSTASSLLKWPSLPQPRGSDHLHQDHVRDQNQSWPNQIGTKGCHLMRNNPQAWLRCKRDKSQWQGSDQRKASSISTWKGQTEATWDHQRAQSKSKQQSSSSGGRRPARFTSRSQELRIRTVSQAWSLGWRTHKFTKRKSTER